MICLGMPYYYLFFPTWQPLKPNILFSKHFKIMVDLCLRWTIISSTSKDGCGVALLNNTRHSPCDEIILDTNSCKSVTSHPVTPYKLAQDPLYLSPIHAIVHFYKWIRVSASVPVPTLAHTL